MSLSLTHSLCVMVVSLCLRVLCFRQRRENYTLSFLFLCVCLMQTSYQEGGWLSLFSILHHHLLLTTPIPPHQHHQPQTSIHTHTHTQKTMSDIHHHPPTHTHTHRTPTRRTPTHPPTHKPCLASKPQAPLQGTTSCKGCSMELGLLVPLRWAHWLLCKYAYLVRVCVCVCVSVWCVLWPLLMSCCVNAVPVLVMVMIERQKRRTNYPPSHKHTHTHTIASSVSASLPGA